MITESCKYDENHVPKPIPAWIYSLVKFLPQIPNDDILGSIDRVLRLSFDLEKAGHKQGTKKTSIEATSENYKLAEKPLF